MTSLCVNNCDNKTSDGYCRTTYCINPTYSKTMISPCPYNCTNKTFNGYCKTTGCIHPLYSNQTATANEKDIIFEPIYNRTTTIEVNRISLSLAKDAYDKIHNARETKSRSSNKVMVALDDMEASLIEELLVTLI